MLQLLPGYRYGKIRQVFHIGDVIRKLRMQRGWQIEDLADHAGGMSKTTISELERGIGNQTSKTIDRVAAALGETRTSLYARLVSMSTGKAETPAAAEPGIEADVLDDDVSNYERNAIPVIQEGEAQPNGLVWDADSRKLSETEEWTSRPYDFRDKGAYAVVIRGDSMEPILKRGMRLLVSPTRPVGDGDLVYVQLHSGERLAKIATRQTDSWLLTSANPAHPPRAVRDDEIEHIHKVAYVRFLK